MTYFLLFVLDGHLEAREGIPGRVAVLLSTLAQHRLHLLRAPAQVHHLTGKVHTLLHQPEVLVLQYKTQSQYTTHELLHQPQVLVLQYKTHSQYTTHTLLHQSGVLVLQYKTRSQYTTHALLYPTNVLVLQQNKIGIVVTQVYCGEFMRSC